MKKKLYYALPFVAVPILLVIFEFIDNMNIFSINPYIIYASLLLFSAAAGFFSPTYRTFDYLLTVITPLSLFCSMFIVGFLGKSDLETQFHLYKAINAALQPIAMQLYFLMAITTFLASFKRFRDIRKAFQINK